MSQVRPSSSSSGSSTNTHAALPADGSTEKSVAGTLPGDEEKQHLGRPQSRSLHTVQSHRSYAAGDGYTRWDEEEEPAASSQAFEVTWDSLPDSHASQAVRNPRLMSTARRWLIVVIVSASSLCVTCASSIYTSTYGQLTSEFHSSRIVATLGLSLFVAGLGCGPMILSPLSEFYGRRPIYIVSYSFFFIWLIPCAVAQNMATILVARFLDGLAGSAFLSVAGGTVGDCFARHELSAPMMIYTASPFIGPEVGPLVGGFINQYTSWRWTFYVMLIWAGVQLAGIVFLVPETYHPVLLRRKAQKLREETGNEAWTAPIERMDKSVSQTLLWSCVRPFQLLVFEPMCLNLCILSSILLGILYLFFGAFPLVFQNNHGFSLSQTGLAFLGLFVGMILGISTDPLWRKNYARLVQRREAQGGEPGGSEPEYRLPPTILGAVIVPIAMFGFGWTTYSSSHLRILRGIHLPRGLCRWALGRRGRTRGLTAHQYPLYAASALAANSFARSSFAAAFPLFGVQMYNSLGYQWATSLLAFLALAMAPFPYFFYRYGKRLRGKSRFASA
ncbi:major facilitator superfamily domain-containing protein [Macrophomina phaseolina]|uniref:Major facilitator superfamily domain-containing protein n=1 Tax=Macrophomina phaseolina TaxID=35725 RepID=A0ABQ8FRU0_9PEZI|nr:major facilitator superfamily domain-containing protein [Macrophomina phaseolina]